MECPKLQSDQAPPRLNPHLSGLEGQILSPAALPASHYSLVEPHERGTSFLLRNVSLQPKMIELD